LHQGLGSGSWDIDTHYKISTVVRTDKSKREGKGAELIVKETSWFHRPMRYHKVVKGVPWPSKGCAGIGVWLEGSSGSEVEVDQWSNLCSSAIYLPC
jgi:hypothetical protein